MPLGSAAVAAGLDAQDMQMHQAGLGQQRAVVWHLRAADYIVIR